MAKYFDWNEAILLYIIGGLQHGSRVFLPIDEEALVAAGGLLDKPPPVEQRVNSFISAVREQCVINGQVHLSEIRPTEGDVNQDPPYLAFLAATVLAAYRMGEEEEISPNNYFTRLNELLGLSNIKQGRPPGMPRGSEGEEGFWLHWANWLTHNGYLHSAKRGMGPQTYIHFPISQTLLRETDKDSLLNHFDERRWPRNLDKDAVIARVVRDRQSITRHLERMLSDRALDSSRRDGLFDAIYEVYEFWTLSGSLDRHTGRFVPCLREISAGLYRQRDPFVNSAEYYVLPQQPRRVRAPQIRVCHQGQEFWLRPERSGWYQPLWRVSPTELDEGFRAELIGMDELQTLALPARDFWVLAPDPDDPESGIFASWSKPSLGVPFILLCKESIKEQLDYLRSEGLVDWRQGDPVRVWPDTMWLEYRDVLAISQGWAGVSIANENLLRTLQPSHPLGMSLRGGMRVPQVNAWLMGYSPEIVVHSFYPEATLEIVDLVTGERIGPQIEIRTNTPLPLELPSRAGNFSLVVASGLEKRETPINVISWLELPAAIISQPRPIRIGSGEVFGALVE